MFNRKPRLCDAFAMSTTPGKPNDGVELTLGIESEKGAEFMRSIATIRMRPDQAQHMYEALKRVFDVEHKD